MTDFDIPMFPIRYSALKENSGAYAPVCLMLPLNKTKKGSLRGTFFGLLRREGKVKKPFQVHGKLLNAYYNQSVTPTIEVRVVGQNLSVFLPIRGNSRTRCETHAHRLTLLEHREHEKQQRLARAKEYQGLMDKKGWTRAELARQLGVSRVWVTTVLKVDQ